MEIRPACIPFSSVSLIKFWLVACMLGCSLPAISQVSATLDTTAIRIGEELGYTLKVITDTTSVVTFPDGQPFLPLEVIEIYNTDTLVTDDRYQLIKKYGLTQFDSGTYTIPSQRILIDDRTIQTDSFLVEVRDVPVDTTKQKMYDIKPAIEVASTPFDFIRLLYWLVPILVLALAGYLYIRRRKRKEAASRKLPPYEEAIAALHQLDNEPLLKENRSKEYYSALTEIVKRYLDREVDDTAMESTSDELIERLQLHRDAGHFDFDSATIKKLDAIFKRADLVKFAKMTQQEEQARADRNAIEEIINETHEAIPEPTEEEKLKMEQYREAHLKKRRKRRMQIAILTTCAVIIATVTVLISIYGITFVKDSVFGHPTKELAEGRWVRSEYGIPAVIIETPEVLVRAESSNGNSPQPLKNEETFIYGDPDGNLYILLQTLQFQDATPVNPEQALEEGLKSLEDKGATNMLVKRESFSTEEGVEGLKAFGTFSLSTEDSVQQREYILMYFGQAGALQQVIITYEESDIYADELAERIVNSIEIEITENR